MPVTAQRTSGRGLLEVQGECNAIAVERCLPEPGQARELRDRLARLEMRIEDDFGY
jgi:hypothetical protein